MVNRRKFLQFMGAMALGSSRLLAGSGPPRKKTPPPLGISPSTQDQVVLAPGLESRLLISWKDVINSAGEQFGYNNDYTAPLPLPKNQLLLWVNHESAHPILASGYLPGQPRTKAQVDQELSHVGGSIIALKKNRHHWKLDTTSPLNRRLNGHSPIPFDQGPIAGKQQAMGTVANCSGGITPWQTILSCEENYDKVYGELSRQGHFTPSRLGWEKFYPNSPLHYGWVVEIEPLTGKATKRIALGRFRHESATCHPLPGGRVVVYSGEDKTNEYLYKFVSHRPNSLQQGELFALDARQGKWISLAWNKQPRLQKKFRNPLEVLTFTRDAARLLGATPLDRPEDIAIHPLTQDVYVCLTNNAQQLRPHGSMLKLSHPKQNHASPHVEVTTFKTGGPETGMTCPDNILFDPRGNLWFTNDISTKWIERGPYKGFGHNGLFLIPASGPSQGKVIQLASSPKEAEFTGPSFSPDGKTLFLSVQHPGELTTNPAQPTSRWPGPEPKPSVIQITGPLLEQMTLG